MPRTKYADQTDPLRPGQTTRVYAVSLNEAERGMLLTIQQLLEKERPTGRKVGIGEALRTVMYHYYVTVVAPGGRN